MPPRSRRAGPASVLSPLARGAISAVLWVEVAANAANGAATLFSPAAAFAPLAADAAAFATPAAALGARSFAALSLAFGALLLARVLCVRRRAARLAALRPLLEALCVGDWLYMGVLWQWARAHGVWPAAAAPFVITLAMFAARATLLFYEDWDESD